MSEYRQAKIDRLNELRRELVRLELELFSPPTKPTDSPAAAHTAGLEAAGLESLLHGPAYGRDYNEVVNVYLDRLHGALNLEERQALTFADLMNLVYRDMAKQHPGAHDHDNCPYLPLLMGRPTDAELNVLEAVRSLQSKPEFQHSPIRSTDIGIEAGYRTRDEASEQATVRQPLPRLVSKGLLRQSHQLGYRIVCDD
jgi:hypothetical protein